MARSFPPAWFARAMGASCGCSTARRLRSSVPDVRIVIGGDHHGVAYKAEVVKALTKEGHKVEDVGTSTTDPVDYPDYARIVGVTVRDGMADVGILICGSGAGVSIAANKIRGVRAALCHDLFTARQSREDDDANVLCVGAKVVTVDRAVALAGAFVGARFSGAERHVRRLAKIRALEEGEAMSTGRAPTIDTLAPVTAALECLERLGTGARIWKKDASLWSTVASVQAAIVNRLGWLTGAESRRAHVRDLIDFAGAVRPDGITDVVLLGRGGSSLAAETLGGRLAPAAPAPALTVLDTTDPGAIRGVRARLKLANTLFIVASKSGTTLEMHALYRFFRSELERAGARPGSHFVAITDSGTPLERLAGEARFRRIFLNPVDIGGRFSALSYFGLVPGALLGVDIATLLERALGMATTCGPDVPVAANPALRLGATLGGLATAGRDKITFVISEPLRSLGAWLEQLLTESTGKQGRGLVVVVDESPASPAVYGRDRVFVGITLGDDDRVARALQPVEAAGHPVIRITLRDRLDVGGEFFRWEMATAAAGILLDVNPFDEPNVAQAKEATQAALATFLERGRLPEWPRDTVDTLAETLVQSRPGDYVALLAYLTSEPATTDALQSLRHLVRDGTRLATTLGYGPRYLHSTGQLHKGGPPTPIAVVMTQEAPDDLPIPGERYGFATLETAQALGDLATLRSANRRALWLPLTRSPVP